MGGNISWKNSQILGNFRNILFSEVSMKKQVSMTREMPQSQTNTRHPDLSRNVCFPTMWHFDEYRLRQACAASF